jgi:spore coat polysaccharide biosynthesis protein SpsF (cytidylyltransferase family)
MVPLAGRPLIEVLLERIASSPELDSVALATSTDAANQPLVDIARKLGIPAFQGDEEDVLRRYVDCARSMGADHVVRVTGDNPLTDLETMERLVSMHLDIAADYTYVPVGGHRQERARGELGARRAAAPLRARHALHQGAPPGVQDPLRRAAGRP